MAEDGITTGNKDRPACIILTVEEDGRVKRVMILPITHSRPQANEPAYRMPSAVKNHLGLDDLDSWIMLDEANIDIWPSPDCLPVPRGGGFTYGRLPQALTAKLKQVVRAAILEKRLEVTDREAEDPRVSADATELVDTWKPPEP